MGMPDNSDGSDAGSLHGDGGAIVHENPPSEQVGPDGANTEGSTGGDERQTGNAHADNDTGDGALDVDAALKAWRTNSDGNTPDDDDSADPDGDGDGQSAHEDSEANDNAPGDDGEASDEVIQSWPKEARKENRALKRKLGEARKQAEDFDSFAAAVADAGLKADEVPDALAMVGLARSGDAQARAELAKFAGIEAPAAPAGPDRQALLAAIDNAEDTLDFDELRALVSSETDSAQKPANGDASAQPSQQQKPPQQESQQSAQPAPTPEQAEDAAKLQMVAEFSRIYNAHGADGESIMNAVAADLGTDLMYEDPALRPALMRQAEKRVLRERKRQAKRPPKTPSGGGKGPPPAKPNKNDYDARLRAWRGS
jgi:hypothetical protein